MTIAMHIERTGDPNLVRWVVKDHTVGPPRSVRFDRSALASHPVADRLLAEVLEITAIDIQGHHLAVRKEPTADWAAVALEVNDVLRRTFEEMHALASLSAQSATIPTTKEVAELVEAIVGALVGSHGGRIEVVDVSHGRVAVRLRGACHGCPAAHATLARALDGGLRLRLPGLREITVVT